MQISIIHGGDVGGSQKKLDEVVGKFEKLSVVRANGGEVTDEFLVNNLSSGDLFAESKVVVVENPEGEIELGKYSISDGVSVVLYFDKELSASNFYLKSDFAKGAKVYAFSKPPDRAIFTFLDLLAEKNEKAYGMLDKLNSEFGEQYLLTMLFYLFRRQIQSDAKLSDFVRRKIDRQRRNFPIERLKELYWVALETDFKIKNGLIDGKNGLFLVVEEILR